MYESVSVMTMLVLVL